MEYTTEILDRTTGDLKTTSLGNWVTVTEYGAAKGAGPRQTRAILSRLGLLQEELELSNAGRSRVARRRITHEAVRAGLGKRIYPTKPGSYPFDVLSPQGQEWVDQRWGEAVRSFKTEMSSSPMVDQAKGDLDRFKASRRSGVTMQMEVCFLADLYPDLPQVDICKITGGSARMVSRYVNIRADQIRAAKARKQQPLTDSKRIAFRPDLMGEIACHPDRGADGSPSS